MTAVRMVAWAWIVGLFVAACVRAPAGDASSTDGGAGADASASADGGGVATDGGGAGADAATDGGAPACPPGFVCPLSFPFHDDGDTSTSARDLWDAYACAPATGEAGPEVVYQVTLPAAGFLSAAVADGAGGSDVDLHLLSAPDPAACLQRGNHQVGAHVSAGTYFIVADSWSDAGGVDYAGAYALDIGFVVPVPGDCAMTSELLDRIVGAPLMLPATGPVVLEAHLVTSADGFGGAWPTSIVDGIDAHYATSFGATDFVMWRVQPWAPMESSEYGQGATGAPLPVEDEGWYVNMYWSTRPPGGTRMIVRLPGGGPAVVAAAGWETGPGDPAHIAGTTEEVHFYLGTGHLDTLEVGFAVDQTLPLGPIDCL